MTKFEELQALHERLMEQSKAPAELDVFVIEVQRDIQQMRAAAEEIPAPRERDQLRAILRFWAAYVYDHTGTYPDTTLHPAVTPHKASPEPVPPKSSRSRVPLFWIALAAGAVLIILLVLVSAIIKSPTSEPIIVKPPNYTIQVAVTPEPHPATRPIRIQSTIVTAGPSPFDDNVWVVKLQLNATGGDDNYIFWANGIRLPDISSNQYTVEGKGCDPEKPIVGVTSGGQATSAELVIHSPLPGCPQP